MEPKSSPCRLQRSHEAGALVFSFSKHPAGMQRPGPLHDLYGAVPLRDRKMPDTAEARSLFSQPVDPLPFAWIKAQGD